MLTVLLLDDHVCDVQLILIVKRKQANSMKAVVRISCIFPFYSQSIIIQIQ